MTEQLLKFPWLQLVETKILCKSFQIFTVASFRRWSSFGFFSHNFRECLLLILSLMNSLHPDQGKQNDYFVHQSWPLCICDTVIKTWTKINLINKKTSMGSSEWDHGPKRLGVTDLEDYFWVVLLDESWVEAANVWFGEYNFFTVSSDGTSNSSRPYLSVETEMAHFSLGGACALLSANHLPLWLTLHAGLAAAPAPQADFIFVNDRCVNVHLFFRWSSFGSFWDVVSPFSFHPSLRNNLALFSSFCFFFFFSFFFRRLILYVVPSVAWGEDGIDELHVVGYVYQELLVCTANFTYIYATSLSTLYSLCLLYNTYTTYWLKYLYKGCTVL